MAVSEEWIKNRAYALWEEDGRPHGKDAEHWQRAALEYQSLSSAKKPAARRKTQASPAAPVSSAPAVEEAPVIAKPKAGPKAEAKAKATDVSAPKRSRKAPTRPA